MGKTQSLHILWQNNDAVAVDKPAGLATIPGRAERSTGAGAVGRATESSRDGVGRSAGAGGASPGQAHQRRAALRAALCRPATFVPSISEQHHRKRIPRPGAGRPAAEEGEIDAPIGRHPTSPLLMAVLRHGGRPARTVWRMKNASAITPCCARLPENRQDAPDSRSSPVNRLAAGN